MNASAFQRAGSQGCRQAGDHKPRGFWDLLSLCSVLPLGLCRGGQQLGQVAAAECREPCGVHRASWVCAIAAVLEEVNELETAVSFTAPSLWSLPPHHQQRRHFNEPVGVGLHLYCSWDCKHTKAMFTLFFSPLKCFFFSHGSKKTLYNNLAWLDICTVRNLTCYSSEKLFSRATFIEIDFMFFTTVLGKHGLFACITVNIMSPPYPRTSAHQDRRQLNANGYQDYISKLE